MKQQDTYYTEHLVDDTTGRIAPVFTKNMIGSRQRAEDAAHKAYYEVLTKTNGDKSKASEAFFAAYAAACGNN